MARPKKNNADYFSHDSNMRSHRKIIALRTKFWLNWYAIYCMLLEHISSCDYFVSKRDDLEKEILAWDFGVSVAEMQEIVSFCDRLKLLEIDWELLRCQSLCDRLKDLTDKRSRERNRVSVAETQQPVAESPQSKVKESKVKESKLLWKQTKFAPPSIQEVESYISEKKYSVNPERFMDYYESIGWMVWKNKMKKRKATISSRESRQNEEKKKKTNTADRNKDFNFLE